MQKKNNDTKIGDFFKTGKISDYLAYRTGKVNGVTEVNAGTGSSGEAPYAGADNQRTEYR